MQQILPGQRHLDLIPRACDAQIELLTRGPGKFQSAVYKKGQILRIQDERLPQSVRAEVDVTGINELGQVIGTYQGATSKYDVPTSDARLANFISGVNVLVAQKKLSSVLGNKWIADAQAIRAAMKPWHARALILAAERGAGTCDVGCLNGVRLFETS